MIDWLWQTAVFTAFLAGIVFGITRAFRLRPALEHAFWLLVLVKMLTPAFLAIPFMPVADWKNSYLARQTTAYLRFETGSAAIADSLSQFPPRPHADESHSTARSPAGSAEPPAASKKVETRKVRRGQGTAMPRIPQVFLADNEHFASADREFSRQVAPSATSQSATAKIAIPWRRLTLILWAAGAVIVMYRHLTRISRFHRLLQLSTSPPSWLVEKLNNYAAALKVPCPLPVVVPGSRSPLIWCVGRPRLVWPRELLFHPESPAVDGIVVHELAHLARRDHLIAWFVVVAEAVWWWNPVFWLVRRKLREAADIACDAWVVWALPNSRRSYAETLLEFSKDTTQIPIVAPALGAFATSSKSLERRLTMIVTNRSPRRMSFLSFVLLLAIALAVLPSWSDGQEAASNSPLIPQAAEANSAPAATSAAAPSVSSASSEPVPTSPSVTPSPTQPAVPGAPSIAPSAQPGTPDAISLSPAADLPPPGDSIPSTATVRAAPQPANPPRPGTTQAPLQPGVLAGPSAAANLARSRAKESKPTAIRVFKLEHAKTDKVQNIVRNMLASHSQYCAQCHDTGSDTEKAFPSAFSAPNVLYQSESSLHGYRRTSQPYYSAKQSAFFADDRIPGRASPTGQDSCPAFTDPNHGGSVLRMSAEKETNTLIVRAAPEILETVADIVSAFDVPQGAPVGAMSKLGSLMVINYQGGSAERLLSVFKDLGLDVAVVWNSAKAPGDTAIPNEDQFIEPSVGPAEKLDDDIFADPLDSPAKNGTLIVTGSKDVLDQVKQLVDQLDGYDVQSGESSRQGGQPLDPFQASN